MFHLIADATSQPVSAWRTWGPAEWSIIIGTVTTSLLSIIAAVAALLKSNRADTNSTNANLNASNARTSADHAGNIAAEARGMAQTAVPTPTIPLTPIAPTPEGIVKALSDCPPENKP